MAKSMLVGAAVALMLAGLTWQTSANRAAGPGQEPTNAASTMQIAESTAFEDCKKQCVKKHKCNMEVGTNKPVCVSRLQACVKACPK